MSGLSLDDLKPIRNDLYDTESKQNLLTQKKKKNIIKKSYYYKKNYNYFLTNKKKNSFIETYNNSTPHNLRTKANRRKKGY